MTSTTILAYDLSKTVLARDYQGCGKAWAAIKGGAVVAIIYKELRRSNKHWPAWVKAVTNNAEGLEADCILPTVHSSKGWVKMAQAASACADCPKPKRKAAYRPSELLSIARAFLLADAEAQFQAHREESKKKLAAQGEVVSGMCSATQFVIHG